METRLAAQIFLIPGFQVGLGEILYERAYPRIRHREIELEPHLHRIVEKSALVVRMPEPQLIHPRLAVLGEAVRHKIAAKP